VPRAKGYLWNLSEWMRRLGLQSEPQPELLRTIQPVQLVGDATALASPLLPPMAWAGGFQLQLAGSLPGMAVRSLAPGGSFLKIVKASAFANFGIFLWEIGAGVHSFTAGGGLRPLQQMGPDDVTAEVRLGTTLAAQGLSAANFPGVRGFGGDTNLLVDGVYISQGTEFYIEMSNSFPSVSYAVLIHDVQPSIPRA